MGNCRTAFRKLSKSLLQQREHSKLSMPWLTSRCEGFLFDWSRRRCACFEGALGVDLGVEGQGRRPQVMVDGSGESRLLSWTFHATYHLIDDPTRKISSQLNHPCNRSGRSNTLQLEVDYPYLSQVWQHGTEDLKKMERL